jgi:hypothetical protein
VQQDYTLCFELALKHDLAAFGIFADNRNGIADILKPFKAASG